MMLRFIASNRDVPGRRLPGEAGAGTRGREADDRAGRDRNTGTAAPWDMT